MFSLFIFIFLTGRTTQTGLALSIKKNIHNPRFPEMKAKHTRQPADTTNGHALQNGGENNKGWRL